MSNYEVPQPILNSPFDEPAEHWFIQEDTEPERRRGRRPAMVFKPQDTKADWSTEDGILSPSIDYVNGYDLVLVNRIRERLKEWRDAGYPGATRTTLDLLQWWQRDGRGSRLFFAQVEATETIIFLKEARTDFLQGIQVPMDDPSDDQKEKGYSPFERYSCKMATGAGKTTVMGMLAAWSILNKVNARQDARFSEVVLVVCPNVTIRSRLAELKPELGEASIYRKRDLVPPHLMPILSQGRIIVTNWHVFEPKTVQVGGSSSRVLKVGIPITTRETITIGKKTTTARGTRYLSIGDYELQRASGSLKVFEEILDSEGILGKVIVESTRYVQSDTSLVNEVLRDAGSKGNILVFNDEAHHAYRIKRVVPAEGESEQEEIEFGEEEEAEEFFKEATVWIEGLDKVQKNRGINFCVDLSATPYFLGRVGQETNRPFPWVVSDFGLNDAIEAGLVKIPQLAIRDTTGAEVPGYFNIWHWILPKLTPAERGGKRANPKPEAILKYAHTPIAMLGGLWEEELREREKNDDDPRPPVFIIVCKNTRIAKTLYEWLADGVCPTGIPPAKLDGFRNTREKVNTIRVDTKVVHETDTDGAKTDEMRWMRVTLDTVGRMEWPLDTQGRPIYPEGFEDLAGKLNRPFHPPGRDIRCIVSVGMLTEGWDCNTVTHIIGLRPFMSQLLCEQVVGRGLRRTTYEVGEDGKFTEEVAKVFGVPFEVIPFKSTKQPAPREQPKRCHIHAVPAKARYEIRFPRVEGYTQRIRNRVRVDWSSLPSVVLRPDRIPPEVEMKELSVTNKGRMSLSGPGRIDEVTLNNFRSARRIQELVFDLSKALASQYIQGSKDELPPHVLFPQLIQIVARYVQERVEVHVPANRKDLFLSPYYGWLVEILAEAIRPDTSAGEDPEIPIYEKSRGPGSTSDVDYWTTRDVREVLKSHLNYVVADTQKWEQTAAYYIDKNPRVDAFAKNAGLGFSIPYVFNGQTHDYVPDFIIRLKGGSSDPPRHLILETKGYDEREEIKTAAAKRWVDAVNTDGSFGRWDYCLVKKMHEISNAIEEVVRKYQC